MSQTKHKVLNKGGGLTIPAEIRREYNSFLGGEAVDLDVVDGKIIIAPHTPKCMFCGSINDVGRYKDRDVCKGCVAIMVKEVGINE